jgi:cytochrome c556
MRAKLENARQLLEAVVGVDYAAIERAAAALGRLTETEIESWQSSVQPDYVNQAAAFLSSVRRLHEAAAKRDIEEAILGYGSLVSSCARCHASVRRSR